MDYGKSEIKRILMERDGLSEEHTELEIDDAQDQINEIMEEGGSLCDAEDVMRDMFGLEPDYLECFLI